MTKRVFDLVASLVGLTVLGPILLIFSLLLWLQDFHSPFYLALRVGKNGNLFRMVKLRTMIAGADKSGVASTAADDRRITKLGHIVRRYKLDEFSQLWNVLGGQMSLVGPRPQVKRDVDLYTDEEMHLLDVLPGITDFSSIVFGDEGKILERSPNPDLDYDQLIRCWKSRLGMVYVLNRSILLDTENNPCNTSKLGFRSKSTKNDFLDFERYWSPRRPNQYFVDKKPISDYATSGFKCHN